MTYNMACHLTALSQTPLFRGFQRSEIQNIAFLLGGDILRLPAGARIPEDRAIYLVLSGQVCLEQEDLWGGDGVVDCIGPGELVESTAEGQVAVVRIAGTVLRLNRPEKTMGGYDRLEENITAMRLEKQVRLRERVSILSRRSVRGRVLTYLSYESGHRGSLNFRLPISRQALADYLCVERTALSAELSQLQRDGLIRFEGSRFTIYPETWKAQSAI